jgi:ketosteroid isomerase-like protein
MDHVKEALLKKDYNALAECYSEQAVLVTPEGALKGRENIRKSYETWLGRFSGLKASVDSKIDAGHQVVEEWTMSAVNSSEIPAGAFGERIPATNESITVHCANIASISDGRIMSHHVYYDQKEIMDQLGMKSHHM